MGHDGGFAASMAAKKLEPKQQRFVEEYLIDLNGTQAAIRAGYSPKGANSKAAQLLAKVSIQEAIVEAQQQRAKRTEVTADWVVERLRSEATLTGDDSSHAARVSALKALGEHLGMFVKRLKVEGEQILRIKHVVVEPGPNGTIRRTGNPSDANGLPTKPAGV